MALAVASACAPRAVARRSHAVVGEARGLFQIVHEARARGLHEVAVSGPSVLTRRLPRDIRHK